jgi:hypothetical protein
MATAHAPGIRRRQRELGPLPPEHPRVFPSQPYRSRPEPRAHIGRDAGFASATPTMRVVGYTEYWRLIADFEAWLQRPKALHRTPPHEAVGCRMSASV